MEGIKSVKVKFVESGFESVMNEEVAAIYEKKGKVKILKEVKAAEKAAAK